ncbi:hypothetical protein GSH19_07040 [Lactobacillus sp. S2-2]|uniref:hypothetical protein n=1 Tax=Lactobacillus sp. S2-2 TaxID=2692917 RepID=UPI001F457C95|nr:hypothetical protein [Lactobacillus sp. S2-2]MCF6515898.1 hypothetical protein [Lactobacillus sp. S2-2]
MANNIKITKQNLIVEPKGLDKLWSLKTKIVVPVNHVMGATIDNGIVSDGTGTKMPGTKGFNKIAGTFVKDHKKSFWNINLKEKILVIQLKDEKYTRLILGVNNNFDESELNNL